MSRKVITQTAFTSGEISPRLYSRTDTTEFQKGVETADNCLIASHGPIRKRNGSQFIAEVKDSSKEVRLIKFQVNKNVSYILEAGHEYIRFFTNSGQVVELAKTITGITQANPGVITIATHGYITGDQVYITSVAGMTEINDSIMPYEVVKIDADTFSLKDLEGNAIDTTAYTAYSSGGYSYRIYEIASPYSSTEVAELQYAQSDLVMYITHPDHAPRTLTRNDTRDWTLDSLSMLPAPTYESGFLNTGETITPGATTGSSITFTASGALFLEGDIGRQIINNTEGETGRASITSLTSATVALCTIVEDFTDTNAIASADWSIDLSPVIALLPNGTQSGAIAEIRSEYATGTLGPSFDITGITQANPGVVTTSAAHGYEAGDRVQINDIVGMTQLNENIYTVKFTTATTFELGDDNNVGLDTTAYTAYSSGGIVRKVLAGTLATSFRAVDIGKYILLNGGVLQITSIGDGKTISAEILKSLNSASFSSAWSLEVETWDATRGFPRAVGLFEQRLVFGGSDAEPQTIWLSEIGIFNGFGVGPDDEDAISISLVSSQVNQINWIAASRDLVIGTSGGELTLSSSSTGVTPSSISQRSRTYYGSDIQQIARIGDEIAFIQNSNRKVRTFRYNYDIDGYTGEDLHFVAEHITEDGLAELAYAQEPDSILYCVTDEGKLLAGVYDRNKRVMAWSTFNTDGDYENIQTISEGTLDQVWTVVQRSVDGSDKRYIELFTEGDGLDDLHAFQDCFLTLSSNKAITNITNTNPAVVTASSHGFVNGDSVVIKDLENPFESELDEDKSNISGLNGNIYTVAGKTANTFQLTGLDTSDFNEYGSGGNAWKRVTTISGLSHLEGKTVRIRAEGAAHADKTVSDGSITLDTASGEVVIGLAYTANIVTLNHEYDIGLGSMQGQRVRWARPLLKVLNSARPTLNSKFLPNRSNKDKMDHKVPLFSGYLEYGALDWSNTSALTITNSEPLPVAITGITGTIDAGVK